MTTLSKHLEKSGGQFQMISISSLPGQRISQHKKVNIIGSHKVVWPPWMVVNTKNSVEILTANSLDGELTWDETLSLSILEQYGRFRHQLKELEKIKLERRAFQHLFRHLWSLMCFVTPQPQHMPQLSTCKSKLTTECTH